MLGFVFSPSCNCCEEPCEFCTAGSRGDKQIVLSGFANAVCTDCNNINGTYTLTYVAGCFWQYSATPITLCGSGVPTLTIGLTLVNESSNYRILCEVQQTYTPTTYSFKYNSGGTTAFDCDSWSNFDLPYLSGINVHCDGSSATCKVTSL